MSLINSYDEDTIESLKEHCKSYDSNLDLSKKVKTILGEYSISILDSIEKGLDIDISDFNEVIDDYFEQLSFYYHDYDDENMQNIKNEIGLLFQYIDTLNLSNTYKFDLIYNFFGRFGDDINESRGFYDLITLDLIRNSKIMNDYLESNMVGGKYALFTKKLYAFLDTLSISNQEKVNYVFRSSYETIMYFIESKDSNLDFYFRKDILDNFTKEELSLLFRTCYLKSYDTLFGADDRFIKVILLMKDYVYENLGRSDEFLDSVLRIINNECDALIKRYINIFIEYYDEYVDGKIVNFKEDEIFNELLSYTLDCDGDLSIINDGVIRNLKSFHAAWIKAEEEKYEKALGSGRYGLLKLKLGVFDLKQDSFNYYDSEAVKNAYFSRVYGINYWQVRFLYNKYGKFLEACYDEIIESDKDTYNTLKDICDIYKFSFKNKNEFNIFQRKFLEYVKVKGLFKITDGLAFISLRQKIDKMFQNSFNRVLFKVEDGTLIKRVRGVRIIDPGVNFNMIVNAINGVGEFFEVDSGFRKKYNTTSNSNNQGICASFINNQNLGVVSLKGPLLGYGNLDICGLHAMGIGDIYSETETTSLKNSNTGTGDGKYFVTPKVLTDYTRFGYNELVIERFLKEDKDNKFKVQPSYIVVYKIDDDYTKTRMYKRGLRIAKEFDIPIILIDVRKVKENEKSIINELEDKLFSNRKVDKELMSMIITRYMNNYTGSLTITRSKKDRGNGWEYQEDFSEEGLNIFLDKVENRFKDLTYVEIKEWNQALIDCYYDEKVKNDMAHEICEYGCSLNNGEFLLKDMGFLDIVENISGKYIDKYFYDCGLVEDSKVIDGGRSPEIKTIVNLANFMHECSYITVGESNNRKVYMSTVANDLSKEEKEVYGLIISYLFGNYKMNYFDNLHLCDKSNLKFNLKSKNFLTEISTSVFSDVGKSPLLMRTANGICNMQIKEFHDLFKPIMDKYGEKSTSVAKVLSNRRIKMISDFKKLEEKGKVKVKKSGE